MRSAWLGASLASALAIAITAGCSVAASGEAPPDPSGGASLGSTTQAIQGGTADGTAHPFAVGVCAGSTKGNCDGFCSGALILPNVVVTARHCVDETEKIIDCKAATTPRFGPRSNVQWITTHNLMRNQTTIGWHHIKQIVTPTDDRVCGHDIALLVLDDVIAPTEAKPAIPGVQYPMGDLDRYARTFTAIGFGNTSPQGFTAGTRRIRPKIPVLCIPGDEYAPCPAGLEDAEFVGGDGTCEGDSGSSAFETNSLLQNAPVSLGVLSRGGQSDDGTTCKQSVYTRLDKYRDFVVKAAEAASKNWTLYKKPVPDWTVYVPPPVDAGPPEAAPPKPPTDLADGEACQASEECVSQLCADTGGGKVCAQPCDEAADPKSCGEGFQCTGVVFVLAATSAPTPTVTRTTTSGCSVTTAAAAPASRSAGAAWAALGLTAGVVLALGRRRRRTPQDRGTSAP